MMICHLLLLRRLKRIEDCLLPALPPETGHLVNRLCLRSCGRAMKGHQHRMTLLYWNNRFVRNRTVDFDSLCKLIGEESGDSVGPRSSLQHRGNEGMELALKGVLLQGREAIPLSEARRSGQADCLA
ncbi:unnamed protein product [Lepidochelys kempii]